MYYRISAASNVPKREYKPRPIKRSPSELNGVSTPSSAKTTGETTILRVLCWKHLLTAYCCILCEYIKALDFSLGYLVNSTPPPTSNAPFPGSLFKNLHQGRIPSLYLLPSKELNPGHRIIMQHYPWYLYFFNSSQIFYWFKNRFELASVEPLLYGRHCLKCCIIF